MANLYCDVLLDVLNYAFSYKQDILFAASHHQPPSIAKLGFSVLMSANRHPLDNIPQHPLCLPRRQKPYVIRSPRRRLAVEVQLENRLENAYNTSLTLQYSRNLHFSSLSIKVTQAGHFLVQAGWL